MKTAIQALHSFKETEATPCMVVLCSSAWRRITALSASARCCCARKALDASCTRRSALARISATRESIWTGHQTLLPHYHVGTSRRFPFSQPGEAQHTTRDGCHACKLQHGRRGLRQSAHDDEVTRRHFRVFLMAQGSCTPARSPAAQFCSLHPSCRAALCPHWSSSRDAILVAGAPSPRCDLHRASQSITTWHSSRYIQLSEAHFPRSSRSHLTQLEISCEWWRYVVT